MGTTKPLRLGFALGVHTSGGELHTMASEVLVEEFEVCSSINYKQTGIDGFTFPGARFHLWRRSH